MLLAGAPACAAGGAEAPPAKAPAPLERKPHASLVPRAWSLGTASPNPEAADPDLAFCGEPDAALARVAQAIAERDVVQELPVDPSDLSTALRAEGSPHVHPHLVKLSSKRGPLVDARERLARLLPPAPTRATRRCGVGRSRGPDGRESVAVIHVDAWADLAPVPRRAHLGRWIQLNATLLAPLESAQFVVVGPRGEPHTIPTSGGPGSARASFSVDKEGPWTAQLLAHTDSGPLPLLEAMTFVGVEPADPAAMPAPGETEGRRGRDDADAFLRMVNGARAIEGRPPLQTHPALERVARAHAEGMQRAGRLGHDVGDGSPADRLRRASIAAPVMGENVAHARTPERGHRALWVSPSHRGNLLDGRFSELGVGTARDADGSVWVCLLFVGFVEAGIAPSRGDRPFKPGW